MSCFDNKSDAVGHISSLRITNKFALECSVQENESFTLTKAILEKIINNKIFSN